MHQRLICLLITGHVLLHCIFQALTPIHVNNLSQNIHVYSLKRYKRKDHNSSAPASHTSILGLQAFVLFEILALVIVELNLSDLVGPAYPSSYMSYQSLFAHRQICRPDMKRSQINKRLWMSIYVQLPSFRQQKFHDFSIVPFDESKVLIKLSNFDMQISDCSNLLISW